MSESFYAAVRVVLPMALLMALGYFVRERDIIDRVSMKRYDGLIFRLFMPVMLFRNIYELDMSAGPDKSEFIFAGLGVVAIFAVALTLPRRLIKDGNKAASLGHAIIRSNYILFGTAVAEGLYGNGNAGAVALLGSLVIPMTNAFGAIILEMNRSGRGVSPVKLFISIMKNPMVVATLAAFAMKAVPFGIPETIRAVINGLAGATTTVSFISLGVGLDMKEAMADMRPLAWGLLVKMILIPAVFLPLSVALGFRGPTLCALMVLFAAPTAVASYPMAVAMGADGPFAAQLVCATTFLSLPTMFLCTFLLRGMGVL